MSGELELAQRALAAAGGDGAQATVTRERSLTLRFARSRPTQATSIDDMTVEACVLRDGHPGRAATNRANDDALRGAARAAEAAAEAAARASGPGAYPGFPEPEEVHAHSGHDADTAELNPATGGDALAFAFAVTEALGVEAHGIWSAAEVTTAIASSRGAVLTDSVTDVFMKVVAIAPSERSGYAAATAVAARDMDAPALAARAARKALAKEQPARLVPGNYPVVMERHAVAALLNQLSDAAFNGLAHGEGRGALSGRLGDAVAAPGVNLADAPRFSGTLPRSFDAEGTPKRPLPLIQDGVAHRVVHDIRSAALSGAATTGHALAAAGSPEGPRPTNLVLAGGTAADEPELCRPIERGIYVTRLWYDNLVRPKETLVTAMTRDGTFLIEDGQITRPLEDMRLTDSILGILERTQALGAELRLTSDGEFYGRRLATGVVCPPLQTSAIRFT